jgi:hypothetical protein
MKYSSFLKRNKQEVQKGIILVVGKHMNRTALGILSCAGSRKILKKSLRSPLNTKK